MPTTLSPSAFSSLSSLLASNAAIALQRGDNDKRGVWGGTAHAGMAGQPVRELQEALVELGAMSATPDGDFGSKTQDAVERFQWYLLRIDVRMRVSTGADSLHGTLESYNAPGGVLVDAFVRAATLAELVAWQQGGFQLSSPLVSMSVAGLANIELSSTFTVLDYPSPGVDNMLVHQDFAPWIRAMNVAAKASSVMLRINQAFRAQNLPVSGAVVPPASKSQHLIGCAVDLNIVDGDTVNTTAMFLAGTQSQGANDFVAAAKTLGMRWGGDFSPKDPPHFDHFLPPAGADYTHSFYFAQRSYDNNHPMRSA